MKISKIGELLDAQVLCGEDKLDREINCACGSDMMSEVLSFTKHEAALLTGLTNIHVLRTCEMLDIQCIVFVRGKVPAPEIVDMANAQGCVLLTTDMPMFTSCGVLFSHGIKGGMRAE